MNAQLKLPESILTKHQKQKHTKHVEIDGKIHTLFIDIRHDDECNNGHNTFSITGSLFTGEYQTEPKSDRNLVVCGCIHEIIEQYAPQFAPFIKWHLVSTDSPMHFVANPLYHAGDRDYNGRSKGEPFAFKRKLMFNDVPFLYTPKKELLDFIDEVGLDANWSEFELIELHRKDNSKGGYQFSPKVSLALMSVTEWHKAPFDDMEEARNFIYDMTHCKVEIVERATRYGEGKERNFKAARESAKWSEATDAQLSLPKEELEKLLIARLPTIIQEFKEDVEKIGFVY